MVCSVRGNGLHRMHELFEQNEESTARGSRSLQCLLYLARGYDVGLAKVDIPSPVLRTGFDTQPQTFAQAQTGAIEESGLEWEGGVGDVGEDGLDFGFAEDDGQAFVFSGAQGLDTAEFDVEHLFLFVEEVDVAPDPVDVGLFGAIGVMFEAEFVPHLIQEFYRRCVHLHDVWEGSIVDDVIRVAG